MPPRTHRQSSTAPNPLAHGRAANRITRTRKGPRRNTASPESRSTDASTETEEEMAVVLQVWKIPELIALYEDTLWVRLSRFDASHIRLAATYVLQSKAAQTKQYRPISVDFRVSNQVVNVDWSRLSKTMENAMDSVRHDLLMSNQRSFCVDINVVDLGEETQARGIEPPGSRATVPLARASGDDRVTSLTSSETQAVRLEGSMSGMKATEEFFYWWMDLEPDDDQIGATFKGCLENAFDLVEILSITKEDWKELSLVFGLHGRIKRMLKLYMENVLRPGSTTNGQSN